MVSTDLARSMIDEVERIRKSDSSVKGWQVTEAASSSVQGLYLGGDAGLDCYQKRRVTDRSVSVQVYVNNPDGTMGQAQLELDPLGDVAAQVHQAVKNAGLIHNPPYDLPLPPAEPYPFVMTADEETLNDPEGAMQSLEARASRACLALEGVRVNSAEIYVNAHRRRTITSTGIEMTRQDTDVYFEAAMERARTEGVNTQEVHRDLREVKLSSMNLDRFLGEMRDETLAPGKTALPPTTERAVILIDAAAFCDLVRAVLDQMDAGAEYNRMPHILPGTEVARGEILPDSEPLTVDLDPLLPAMALSTPFTREGLIARGGRMIEANRSLQQTISHRMGSYLAKRPNGLAGNIVVPGGLLSKGDLLASVDECIEVLSFSSLLVNSRSLTYSSEIKLGRIYRRGIPTGLVKGGVVSGNILENLASARYASKVMDYNKIGDAWRGSEGYRGPEAVLFRTGVRIAGE